MQLTYSYMCMMSLLVNFKQNIQQNRLDKREIPERKIARLEINKIG